MGEGGSKWRSEGGGYDPRGYISPVKGLNEGQSLGQDPNLPSTPIAQSYFYCPLPPSINTHIIWPSSCPGLSSPSPFPLSSLPSIWTLHSPHPPLPPSLSIWPLLLSVHPPLFFNPLPFSEPLHRILPPIFLAFLFTPCFHFSLPAPLLRLCPPISLISSSSLNSHLQIISAGLPQPYPSIFPPFLAISFPFIIFPSAPFKACFLAPPAPIYPYLLASPSSFPIAPIPACPVLLSLPPFQLLPSLALARHPSPAPPPPPLAPPTGPPPPLTTVPLKGA